MTHKALAPFESKNHQFSNQIDVDLPITMYHSIVLVQIERSQPKITSAAPGSKTGGGNTVLGNKTERDQQ
jgi:hypothetical protein